YDPRLQLPYVPLSDGVGEVVAVGDGVTRVAVGDHACPTFSPGWIDGEPDPGPAGRAGAAARVGGRAGPVLDGARRGGDPAVRGADGLERAHDPRPPR